jgi:hypothetical protein
MKVLVFVHDIHLLFIADVKKISLYVEDLSTLAVAASKLDIYRMLCVQFLSS